MHRLIENLRLLDRKERFAVLRDVLGFHPVAPHLDCDFRNRLAGCIDREVPKHCFLAMDYHLDWIELALHLTERSELQPGRIFLSPNPDNINKSQEDTDLLVAFEETCAEGVRTHVVLIEAKAYLPWSNDQLESKVRRLRKIFGAQGNCWNKVTPHFVLMTSRVSKDVRFNYWPDWMKKKDNEEPSWLEYQLPFRHKVTRCDANGNASAEDGHLRLD